MPDPTIKATRLTTGAQANCHRQVIVLAIVESAGASCRNSITVGITRKPPTVVVGNVLIFIFGLEFL